MKTKTWRYAPLLLALGVAGCANMRGLAPEGKLIDADTLASDKSLSGVRLSHAAWPASDWWRSLGDPQLDAMIDEALKGNPDLAAADARVRLAAAQAFSADAARMPEFSFEASAPGARLPESIAPGALGGNYVTIKQPFFSFNYTFDLWGGKRSAWEAALGQQRATEIDARAVRLMLSVDVARAYSRLAYAFEGDDVARNDLERAQRLLALTKQRVKAGIDAVAQQRQAEATVAAAEQRAAQSAQAIESGRTGLAVLLGKGPDRGLEIARPVPLKPLDLALPDALPADLIGRRPDLVAARWRVEAGEHSIHAAKTQFYPNINLKALAGTIALHTADVFELGNRFALITPAISLPIFDGGRLRANLAAQDANYDLAVAQYNRILVSALNEVSGQVSQLQSLVTQEAAQRRAIKAAREAWDLATLRYRNGIGSYLEVLSVQQQLLAADLQLASLHAQQVDASIQLVRALGGGYRDDTRVAASRAANASTN